VLGVRRIVTDEDLALIARVGYGWHHGHRDIGKPGNIAQVA
jgi:hypothetical protein